MNRQQKKKAPRGAAKASDTLIGLLDAHLKHVVDALIKDGGVDKGDFPVISAASEKFIASVAPELLAVELTPLLKLIRPDRYNAARNRRNGKGNGTGRVDGGKESPALLEYQPSQSTEDEYLRIAGGLFHDHDGEVDF